MKDQEVPCMLRGGGAEGSWVDLMNASIWVCDTLPALPAQPALPPVAGLLAQPSLPAETAIPAKAHVLFSLLFLSSLHCRVFTRGDFLHIAPNSPHFLKPWRFVAIFMLEYGMWRTLRLQPSSHTWNKSKSSNGSGENFDGWQFFELKNKILKQIFWSMAHHYYCFYQNTPLL